MLTRISESNHGLFCLSLLGGLLVLTGCHSWSPSGYPMSGVSRVPPPGTGTYQLPQGYYNNAVAPANQTTGMPGQPVGGMPVAGVSQPVGNMSTTGMQSGTAVPATGGVQPVNGALPSTTLTGGSVAGANVVQPAGFQASAGGPPAAAQPSFVTPAFAAPPGTVPGGIPLDSGQGMPATGSISSVDAASSGLNWQTP